MRILIFLLLAIYSCLSFAETSAKDVILKRIDFKRIDRVHSNIKKSWHGMNVGIDRFFAAEVYEEETNQSFIKTSLTVKFIDGDGSKTESTLKLQTDFPNTTKDLKIVIQKEREELSEEVSSSAPTVFASELNDDSSQDDVTAAGRFRWLKDKKWNLYTDFGFVFNMPLDPFVKLRLRRRFDFKKSRLDLVQKLQYFRIEETKHESIADFKYELNKQYSISSTNSFSYQKYDGFYSFYNILSLRLSRSAAKTFTYSIGASGDTEITNQYNNYFASASMRKLIHKDWMFFVPTTGVNFPREFAFQRKGFIFLTVEAYF